MEKKIVSLLVIKNLHVAVDGIEILKGVNLTLSDHETVALLGPNGHGKTTLLAVIMGHPKYQVISGEITLDGKNLLIMTPDQRAKAGLFLGMQNPSEVPGVVNSDFLKAAINSRREKPISLAQFYRLLDDASKEVKIPLDMVHRSLNEGFSGGEKKRNEILQLNLLNPNIAMLDEIDSGLDIDALAMVGKSVTKLQNKGTGFLIISHYARFYQNVIPNRVVVMIDGRIVLEGGVEIIERIDNFGYEWLSKELGIKLEKKSVVVSNSIGICATKKVVKNG
jgi:Fe-S cluster assembly ATP-binding protein